MTLRAHVTAYDLEKSFNSNTCTTVEISHAWLLSSLLAW